MLRDLVQHDDALFVSSGSGEPRRLIAELLTDVVCARERLTFFQVLTGSEGRLLEAVRSGHRLMTPAPGVLREAAAHGALELVSLSMRQCAAAIEAGGLPVDGALVTAVRRGSDLVLAPAADLSMVAFERARFRAVEVLPAWPHPPLGPVIKAEDVDYLVDAGHRRSAPVAPVSLSETSRRIGELVAKLVPDGATVELGVGGALDGVGPALVAARRRLSLHTGLITDSAQLLVEAGVAVLPLACAEGRPVAGAVAMGSPQFGQWLEGGNHVAFLDSRHAHDPHHLMTLTPFVAINSAMAMDLRGQVGTPESLADAHPPGGLLDFAVAGAYAGLSIVAMTSRTARGRTRFADRLQSVHLPRSLVTHVVTEQGVADLRGKSASECQTTLAAVAHPDDRSHLLARLTAAAT